MGKTVKVLACAMLMLSLCAGTVQAAGLGVYAQGGGGSGSFEWEDSDSFDVDETAVAVGFVLDTSTRDASGFNYRLQVGYEALELKDEVDDTLDMNGVVIDNTFGFAMVRNPGFRLWMGPQVRVGYFSGEDVDLGTFGLGVVLGANFAFSEAVGMSVAGGVRFAGYAGEDDLGDELTGGTTTGFVDVSLLFETGR